MENSNEDDTSLDDFFAKKDRSKKKSKKQAKISVDMLAAGLAKVSTGGDDGSAVESIEPDHKTERLEKRKAKKKTIDVDHDISSNSFATTVGGNDADWNEFQANSETDYSGLKISMMQARDDNSDDVDNGDENESGKNGKRGQVGPWNVQQLEETVPTEEPAQPEPAPVEAPKTGKYVPPSMRSGSSQSMSMSRMMMSRKKKAAPNLSSEMDFPTLGGDSLTVNKEIKEDGFKLVEFGNRQLEDVSERKVDLELDNKYAALKEN